MDWGGHALTRSLAHIRAPSGGTCEGIDTGRALSFDTSPPQRVLLAQVGRVRGGAGSAEALPLFVLASTGESSRRT